MKSLAARDLEDMLQVRILFYTNATIIDVLLVCYSRLRTLVAWGTQRCRPGPPLRAGNMARSCETPIAYRHHS